MRKGPTTITSVHICAHIHVIAVCATQKRSTRERGKLPNIRDNSAFPVYECRYHRAASAFIVANSDRR